MTKTCLIVDESRVIRLVARKILQKMDFRTEEASGGEEALEACRRGMPDAILLDGMPPTADGVAFLKALRAMPEGGKPVVVLCSERLDETFTAEVRDAGADGTLGKPYDGELLRAAFLEAGAL